jgi:hypothetical protein
MKKKVSGVRFRVSGNRITKSLFETTPKWQGFFFDLTDRISNPRLG